MMFKKILLLPLVLFLFLNSFSITSAEAHNDTVVKDEVLEGIVTKIVEEKEITPEGSPIPQLYQKMELFVTQGSLKDKKIIIESGNLPSSAIPKFKGGDKLVVIHSQDFEGKDAFYIADYVRRDSLFWLFYGFILLTVIIARWQGFTSIIGMAFSFTVLFAFTLPQISSGQNPILIAIASALIIIPITFYLSHGINKKTTSAVAGTIVSLIITGLLANFFIEYSKLTGFASEEARFLESAKQGSINIQGLLLAGIIIGALGILDDITISQAAIVYQLKEANKKFGLRDLFTKAMNVGRDHIASVVNTLVLVYTGAALPLLLLFINNPQPFSEVINYEIIAEEIVRTLVASIGLILAVPLTTLIASFVASRKVEKKED